MHDETTVPPAHASGPAASKQAHEPVPLEVPGYAQQSAPVHEVLADDSAPTSAHAHP